LRRYIEELAAEMQKALEAGKEPITSGEAGPSALSVDK